MTSLMKQMRMTMMDQSEEKEDDQCGDADM
jgi:hypothetical protein